MKNFWLIILIGGLGAECGKKENEKAGKPGAGTSQPPPSQPKVAEKPKPSEPPASPPVKKLRPLPAKLAEAWEKAGFSRNDVAAWEKARFIAGWMGPHKEYGFIRFSESLEELDASKAVPAFKLRKISGWRSGVLEFLPAPATAFGLVLDLTKITAAGPQGGGQAPAAHLASLEPHPNHRRGRG